MQYRWMLPLVILLLGASSNALSQKLDFEKQKHDFGMFSPDTRELTHAFTFTNRGGKPLKLKSVKASCGCTTPEWPRKPIEPGETGKIEVVYDATTSKGYFRKHVTVITENAGMHELTIEGEQSKPSRDQNRVKGFEVEQGKLAFKKGYVDFGHLPLGSRDTGYLTIYNSGKTQMRIVKLRNARYLQAPGLPRTIQPRQNTKLMLTFTTPHPMSAGPNTLGSNQGKATLLTNDRSQPYKDIGFKTSIYPPVKQKDQSKGTPTAKLLARDIDLGTVGGNNLIKTGTVLKNTGDAPLIIKGTDSKGCGCEAPVPDKKRLKPGEQTNLRITLNTSSYSGRLNKTLDIYTNDPENPYVSVNLRAYIE